MVKDNNLLSIFRSKENSYYIVRVKRIVYVAIFAYLCYLDHIIGSAEGYMQTGLKIYTGIFLAIIILMNYKLKDYLKLPYAVWSVAFFIGRQLMLKQYYNNCLNNVALVSVLWGIGVYGVLLIRLFYLYVIEKKNPKMKWISFFIFAVMFLLMMIIRTDFTWPRDIGIALVLFFLTDFKEKDLNNLYLGMVEGIILGFILCQGFAWIHRPYMNEVRYLGMYCHPGMNALFYIFVYCAILCKWYQMKLKRRHLFLRITMVLLAGLVLATVLYTGSRTALICIVLVTVLFLFFQFISSCKWKLVDVLIDGGALVLAMVVCIVPAFMLIRYVPEKVDDYVFFAYDKEFTRQIEFEEVSTELFERLFWFSGEIAEDVHEFINELFELLMPVMIVEAESWEEEYNSVLDEDYVEPGTDREHPLFSWKEQGDPVKTRLGIYKFFINRLELVGEENTPQGVWLSRIYLATHTHNFFLQIAYDFGIIVAVLLITIVLMLYGRVIKGLFERKSGAWYFRLFCTAVFVTAFLAFGMLEITWTYGQIGFTLFWMMQYPLYHKEEPKKIVTKD